MGSIFSIVYQPPGTGHDDDHFERFARRHLQSARLIAGHGIEGDRKGGHQPARQLNLLSREWLMRLETQGYKTAPGEFGEQITVTGIDLEGLKAGDRLQLGSTACIEIAKPRTGCERLEAAQGRRIDHLGPIGVMARVVVSGSIRVGDPVVAVASAPDRTGVRDIA